MQEPTRLKKTERIVNVSIVSSTDFGHTLALQLVPFKVLPLVEEQVSSLVWIMLSQLKMFVLHSLKANLAFFLPSLGRTCIDVLVQRTSDDWQCKPVEFRLMKPSESVSLNALLRTLKHLMAKSRQSLQRFSPQAQVLQRWQRN